VFDELAQRYADRAGGYTRVVRMEPRKGDGASMALLELMQ
jgi:large subunit ribosomal protein L17